MSTGDCLAAGAIEVGDSGLDIRPRRCRFAPLQVSPASPRERSSPSETASLAVRLNM